MEDGERHPMGNCIKTFLDIITHANMKLNTQYSGSSYTCRRVTSVCVKSYFHGFLHSRERRENCATTKSTLSYPRERVSSTEIKE